MKLAWVTDPHFDHAVDRVPAFIQSLKRTNADTILITGDIAESQTWCRYLRALEMGLEYGTRIRFVLGNHDYYRSDIASVQTEARETGCWLQDLGCVRLSEKTSLVGADGWGDFRAGNPNTKVRLNDSTLIKDLLDLGPIAMRKKLNDLGTETYEHLKKWLPVAAEESRHVIVATHVPPFVEACWHEGKLSEPDFQPYFVCLESGRVILEVAEQHPNVNFTVLCGHTHSSGTTQPAENVFVSTGSATYGHPEIQGVWDV